MESWKELASKLEADGTDFMLPPQVRFAGGKGEQATFFIADPSGNALEFKAFAGDAMVFQK